MSDQIVLRQELPVGAIRMHASGWWAMIFVIATEAALFGYLLFSYFYIGVQPHSPGAWPQGGNPSLTLALPDTIILLASSAAIYWGELGRREGSNRRLVAGLAIGVLLGVIFLVVQGFEWAEKSFTPSSSPYGSLYFTVTGFHMAHVVVGVIGLICVLICSARGYFDRVRYAPVQIVSLYWHFVDAVWLCIFFTFYITPRLAG
jgi:cytochrome c oxidase subunit 3